MKWNFQGWPKEKIVEFPGSWFLALEFQRDITQFCRISRGGALLSGISRDKVKKWKIPVGFSKKHALNPPVCFFARIADFENISKLEKLLDKDRQCLFTLLEEVSYSCVPFNACTSAWTCIVFGVTWIILLLWWSLGTIKWGDIDWAPERHSTVIPFLGNSLISVYYRAIPQGVCVLHQSPKVLLPDPQVF